MLYTKNKLNLAFNVCCTFVWTAIAREGRLTCAPIRVRAKACCESMPCCNCKSCISYLYYMQLRFKRSQVETKAHVSPFHPHLVLENVPLACCPRQSLSCHPAPGPSLSQAQGVKSLVRARAAILLAAWATELAAIACISGARAGQLLFLGDAALMQVSCFLVGLLCIMVIFRASCSG